jgi:uncharacterized protein (DUF1778 family)
MQPHTHSEVPVTISIRAKERQRDLIDQAAMLLGKNRSDFMLETACLKAEDILLDRTFFALAADAFEQFENMLNNPPEPTDKLSRLLHKKAPWE